MASVNKVIIIGNLGKDPEVRYAPSGMAVCNITVATSRKWKDKTSGEMQEETEWHRISLFDRMAENAGEYLSKGKPVYIEGRLKTRKYQKEGVDHYVTEIMADHMQFLGSRDEGGGQREAAPPARREAPPARRAPPPARSGSGFDDMMDDIPF